MAIKKSSKRSPRMRLNKLVLLLAGLAILLVGLSAFTYSQIYTNNPASDNTLSGSSSQDGEYVNLDPPTEQDKKETEVNKQNLANENQTPPEQDGDGKTKVVPAIIRVDAGVVRAQVPGIVEDGGKCTATAKKNGSPSVSKSSTGLADAKYTVCPPINLEIAGSGWSISVSYSSSTASGVSDTWMVE